MCQDRTAGDKSLYAQQVATYRIAGIRGPHPRQLFAEDLHRLLEKATKEHNDIIVAGDFNENIGDPLEKLPAVVKI